MAKRVVQTGGVGWFGRKCGVRRFCLKHVLLTFHWFNNQHTEIFMQKSKTIKMELEGFYQMVTKYFFLFY